MAAINERKVPTEYLEDFLGAVNELQAKIPPCAEAPAEDEGDEGDENGKGKKKGHDKKDKHDDEGGDD